MANPLYRWYSVHSMHLSSEPPPEGAVWFVVQRSDRKQPCLMVQRGDHLAVAAYFRNEDEARAFADLLGGVNDGDTTVRGADAGHWGGVVAGDK